MTERTDLSVHLWKPCRPEEFVKEIRDILDWASSELNIEKFEGKVECLEMGGETWPGIAVVLELHDIPFALVMSTSEREIVCMKRTKDMEALMLEQYHAGDYGPEPDPEPEPTGKYEPPLPPLPARPPSSD